MLAAVCSAGLLLLPLNTAATAGAIRYVKPSGSDASSSCSLAAPCQTVQRAVAVAADGDEIRVAGGIYTGSMTDAALDPGLHAVVILSKAITAFSGGYSADFSMRDPNAFPTTLSASG